jgi:hypothetical protein
VLEFTVVNLIVVCGSVKSGVNPNSLTSVFCVGVQVVTVVADIV